jgi:U3 small nucleolar RNA-associated protein 16
VVATRRRGELPPLGEPATQHDGSSSTPRTRKRKSIEITNTVVIEEDDDEPPEVVSSTTKRRRTVKSIGTPAKKLEIRTKDTRPVVEIPFMDPIPVSELSTPTAEAEKAVVPNDHSEKEEEAAKVNAADASVSMSFEIPVSQLDVQATPKSSNSEPSDPEDHATPSKAQPPAPIPTNKPLDTFDLLPEEFLQDDEDDEEGEEEIKTLQLPSVPVKAKKTTFADLAPIPKDRRIGSTTYKVTKVWNSNLAPPSLTQARKTKEAWLQGRAGTKLGTNRKPFSKGFFVSKK